MRLKNKIFIGVVLLSIPFIFYIIPNIMENRIRKEAPALLNLNNFRVIKAGEFSFWRERVQYVIERDSISKSQSFVVKDTVYVGLSKGHLFIEPK